MVFQSTKGAGNSCIGWREIDLLYLTINLLNLTWHSCYPGVLSACLASLPVVPRCRLPTGQRHRESKSQIIQIGQAAPSQGVGFGKYPEIKALTCWGFRPCLGPVLINCCELNYQTFVSPDSQLCYGENAPEFGSLVKGLTVDTVKPLKQIQKVPFNSTMLLIH